MNRDKPVFLITIDTEGDNAWSRPSVITTENARFIPRFQGLCESFGFKPTYLTNYEMALDDGFVDFAKDAVARKHAEVGMHLHAWHSPSVHDLTGNDYLHQPYLIEYPDHVIREKIAFMTKLLEQRFEQKMLSHRAGRWAFNSLYARTLVEFGYKVDCSVTPLVSWAGHAGAPHGQGGVDYQGYPAQEYFMDLERISQPGASDLLELPMTILPSDDGFLMKGLRGIPIVKGRVNRWSPSPLWFRPNGYNRRAMKSVLERCLAERRPYVEFMTHSSELMPAGCPTFPNRRSIDNLYADLESVFDHARSLGYVGMTLAGYRQSKYRDVHS